MTIQLEKSIVDPPWEELQADVEGEVRTDLLSRRLYATDASIYQELPLGVVRPKHADDCVTIVQWAARHGVPIIPRTAGTSLAGQVVGAGLILDVSRHMTRVSEIDESQRRAWVEPGVILDDLCDKTAEMGLEFGPDTSTSDRCMIGGMIGNNSCGSHSIIHGTTRDHVVDLEAVLGDGSVARFGPLTAEELEWKKELDTLEGRIYREVFEIVDQNRESILKAFPKPDVKRRNGGYALDRLAQQQPWYPEGEPFNLAPFLCGSEGTLALVTEATLNLVPRPKRKLVVVGHFDSLDEMARATVVAVKHKPAAVELIDDIILQATKGNLEQSRNRFWVEGDPGAVLAVELYAFDGEDLQAQADALIDDLRRHKLGYAYPIVQQERIPQVWALRKAGLGLLMGVPGDVKATTVMEDTSVAVDDLPAYVERLQALMRKHEIGCCFYAHASVGLLHVRPELNLKSVSDREKFKTIAQDAADLVKEFGGAISGEHGDGRLRSPMNEYMFGSEVYGLFKRVKNVFDPKGIFNPNKIVDAHPIDHQLRFSTAPHHDVPTYFDWSADQGLLRAAEKCNGAGACRKSEWRGTMCPSYKATKEELHTTRARANVFRQLLTSDHPNLAFSSEELERAMELCLSCKGCKSECPANVDVARLKAEFLQQRYDRLGTPLRAWMFGEFGRHARMARWTPKLASWFMNTGLFKRLAGVHPKRNVPGFATETFETWWAKHTPHANAGKRGRAVLFADLFTNYQEPGVGVAAAEVLERAGFKLTVPSGIESGRTQISKGLLRSARRVITHAVEALYPYAGEGQAIVGLEPSAILTFTDEAPDLVEGADLKRKARVVAGRAKLFEEFMAEEAEREPLSLLPLKSSSGTKVFVHGHCHEKAIVGVAPLLKTLALIPDADISAIPSGCCGMAGSFGYQAENYEISMAIGEQVLFPAIRKADESALICVPGTSCRHQIKDGTGRQTHHPAEVLRKCML